MKLQELAYLFERDLNRLKNEISLYSTGELIWVQLPGTINSGGHICQHLIGNLKTYIGLQIGGFAYVRDREAEFSQRNFTAEQLIQELDNLLQMVPPLIRDMNEENLAEPYPYDVVQIHHDQTYGFILMHLCQHLAWHTGQINYHRRIVNVR